MKTRNAHDPTAQAILNAARQLVASGGSWSMSDVARAAGISRATVYRRFASRADVEQALRDAGVEGLGPPGQTRERCLDAVGRLALRVGLPRMTLEAVAQEADVGIASVYRVFESRSGLLQAFARERGPRAQLEQVMLDPDTPLQDALETLVEAVTQQVYAQAPWLSMAISGDRESRALVADLLELEREGRARLTDFMEARVRRGDLRGEPATLSKALLALAAGRALLARVEGAPPSSEDSRALVRLFLQGARA